jgi:hypothetical protein
MVNWIGRSIVDQSTGVAYAYSLARLFPDVWGSRIHHLPSEPRSSIIRRQSTASFVIVPSNWDVFNLTAVESMYQNAVVICSTGAGASELIEHGINGFLFEAEEPHSLASAIRQVQSLSDTKRLEIGVNASNTIKSKLDPRRIATLIYEELAQATKLQNQPSPPQDLLKQVLSPTPFDISEHSMIHRSLDRISLSLLSRHILRRLSRKLSFLTL